MRASLRTKCPPTYRGNPREYIQWISLSNPLLGFECVAVLPPCDGIFSEFSALWPEFLTYFGAFWFLLMSSLTSPLSSSNMEGMTLDRTRNPFQTLFASRFLLKTCSRTLVLFVFSILGPRAIKDKDLFSDKFHVAQCQLSWLEIWCAQNLKPCVNKQEDSQDLWPWTCTPLSQPL